MTAPMRVSKADKLLARATTAARVRAYQADPDVGAVRIEKVRGWSAGLIWIGIVLGLAFTMTNVQQFAAHGAPAGSLVWCSAWLLDPMVSLVLVGVLLAEQVTSRWQIDTPVWARRTKWFALAATYVMNTWQPWESLSASGIVLHSVPPLLVFTAVEGGPAMRDALTAAVTKSLALTRTEDTDQPTNGGHEPADTSTQDGVHAPTTEPVRELVSPVVREPRPPRTTKPRTKTGKKTGRVFLADYLAMAREHLTDDVTELTPAWCKAVTGCSTGTAVKLAAALTAERADQAVTAPVMSTTGEPEGKAA